MLIVVLGIAVVGIVVLTAAILTDSTIIALVVIALAAAGLLLLAREWWGERSRPSTEASSPANEEPAPEAVDVHSAAELEPDGFEPDIPYEAAASEEADPAVDDNDSAGDIGAGPARQKH
jgi:hypothetical protein